ncbi:MAG TPA: ABC transporter substrate-binding protein [Candidatus Binatia bacterium]|jgi:NitT/TauT family transport system substrate-binding protein|nr:ABC transporter substrate-binding protein [Candidatus Binatia bacterium]
MRKPIFGLLAVIAVVHWFSLPASSQVTRLKAAYSSESSWSLATWVAYDAGLFKKYGLSVDLVLIRSAATITTALIAGETPMIQLGGNGTIQAALQGADTVNVQTLVPIIPQSLVVTADIKSPEDLKGKRLGVSRFGALSDLVIRHYLRKFGLDPAKDVTIIQVGGIPELLAAMKAGAISGGSLSPPVLSAAKKAGFKELGDFESLDYKYPAVAIATTRSFIQRQRSTALNFLRAEIEGIHAIRTQKNFAVNTLKKYMRISDPDILEEGYRYAVRFIQPRPLPTTEETRAVLEELKRPDAKPENFIDLSLMQELEKEKFFEKFK